MAWYTITKKVKGRGYRYRQRSFRVGGKVRTESVYLGPVDGIGSSEQNTRGVGEEQQTSPMTLDQPVITTSEQATVALEVLDLPGDRPDVSLRALEREHELVLKQMSKHELPVDNLLPVRVGVGDKLDRYRHKTGYYVFAPRSGQRNAFKQEYRRALADRWLHQVERCDPVLFNSLRCALDKEQRKSRAALTRMIFLSGTPHKFRSYLWFMWSGRLPADLRKKIKPQKIGLFDHEGGGWRDDAVKLAAEMIQHGGDKVFRKYEAETNRARARRKIEYDIYHNMGFADWLSGRARKQRTRLEKATAWVESRDALERKSEVMDCWFQLGTL